MPPVKPTLELASADNNAVHGSKFPFDQLKEQMSPGGTTKTFDGSMMAGGFPTSAQATMAREAALVDHLLDSQPLALPQFEDSDSECDSLDDDQDQDDSSVNPGASDNTTFQGDFAFDNIGEIQVLTNQNMDLCAKITEQKEELEEMQTLLEALEPIPGIDVNSLMDVMHGSEVQDQDIRDKKIVQQAKKLRQFNVMLNKEKGRVASLSEELKSMQQELESRKPESKSGSTSSSGKTTNPQLPTPPEVDPATGLNLPGAMKKIDLLRMKVEKANTELKKMQRVLMKEVGENVSVSELLNSTTNQVSGGGWKGRSETILKLKSKIKRLEQIVQDTKSGHEGQKHAPQEIAVMRQQRQQQHETLEQEHALLREQLTCANKKQDASKLRTRTLEKDLSKTRTQLKVLLEKSKTDNKLIEAYQEELQGLRQQLHQRSSTIPEKDSQRVYSHPHAQIEQQQQVIEKLQQTIAEYEKNTHSPNETTDQLRRTSQKILLQQDQTHVKLLAEKDTLLQQIQAMQHEDAKTLREMEDLREENMFLGKELNKLQDRYTKLVETMQ